MLIKETKKGAPVYLENWPVSYYEMDEPEKRREALETVLAMDPDSAEEQERKAIFDRRYSFDKRGQSADRFIAALLHLEIIGREAENFFNRKRHLKEIRKHLETLGVTGMERTKLLRMEWEDAACLYMTTMSDRSGRGKYMGLIPQSDAAAAYRLQENIKMIGVELPKKAGLEEEARELHEILLQAYDQILGEDFGKKKRKK